MSKHLVLLLCSLWVCIVPISLRAQSAADADFDGNGAVEFTDFLAVAGALELGSADSLWQDEPLLASLTAASVQGAVETGERAGQAQ